MEFHTENFNLNSGHIDPNLFATGRPDSGYARAGVFTAETGFTMGEYVYGSSQSTVTRTHSGIYLIPSEDIVENTALSHGVPCSISCRHMFS